jgi:hypothetical protein
MITVRIAGQERQWNDPDDAEEGWITQQIGGRRAAGERVCVTVGIHTSYVNVGLSTPGCASGGGGRRPNDDEARIIDLWERRGLNDPNFAPGNIVAFLGQLARLL